MDKGQLIPYPANDTDMRNIQSFDGCNEADNIPLLYSFRQSVDLRFRNIIIGTGVDLFFFGCDPGDPFRMVFQRFVAVRMRRHERYIDRQGDSSYFVGNVFYDSFSLVLKNPVGRIMQTVGIIDNESFAGSYKTRQKRGRQTASFSLKQRRSRPMSYNPFPED